jgi:hypothetical protein
MADLRNNYVAVINEESGVAFIAVCSPEIISEAESLADEQACQMSFLQPHIDLGRTIFLVHKDDVANFKSQAVESRKKIYWTGSEISIDTDWSHRVMPDKVIFKRRILKQQAKIEAELAKPAPDMVLVATVQNEISDMMNNKPKKDHSQYWLDKGLDGLDERVTDGDGDKPLARQKINDKKNQIGE